MYTLIQNRYYIFAAAIVLSLVTGVSFAGEGGA